MSGYTQLTQGQGYQIEALLKTLSPLKVRLNMPVMSFEACWGLTQFSTVCAEGR